MKNTRELGMIAGIIGGAICVLGGLLSLVQGLSSLNGVGHCLQHYIGRWDSISLGRAFLQPESL
jgi:hypothetical protein